MLLLLAGCSYLGTLATGSLPEIKVSRSEIAERNITIGERLAVLDRQTTVTFFSDGYTTQSLATRELTQYGVTKDSVIGVSQVIAGAVGSGLTLLATKGAAK